MNRRGLWAAGVLLILLVVGAGVLTVGAGYAKGENTAKAKCSEATLKGTYLFAQNGVEIKGNDQKPFALAGYEVFDGNGKLKTVFSLNENGKITRNETLSGTYTVKADCTGTNTFISEGETFKHDMFIAPDGSMLTIVRIKPPEQVRAGFELQGTAKRVGD
jgi:hypothetical protein